MWTMSSWPSVKRSLVSSAGSFSVDTATDRDELSRVRRDPAEEVLEIEIAVALFAPAVAGGQQRQSRP